ncbi:MAG: hypothetical protein L0956_10090 [Candidatus Mariimomonas ferrooxydans]
MPPCGVKSGYRSNKHGNTLNKGACSLAHDLKGPEIGGWRTGGWGLDKARPMEDGGMAAIERG